MKKIWHELELWRKVMVTTLILLLIGGLSYGLVSGQLPLPDNPEFTEDEVVAKVKSYLIVEDIISAPYEVSFDEVSYLGKGKWSGSVSYLVEGKWSGSVFKYQILWNFYENHQTVEIVWGWSSSRFGEPAKEITPQVELPRGWKSSRFGETSKAKTPTGIGRIRIK